MSHQTIQPPTDADIDLLARQLMHADAIAREIAGSSLDGTRRDLHTLQMVVDSRRLEKEASYSLQALWAALGRLLVDETLGFDWCTVEDEDGKALALRYKDTQLLVFPRPILSKRIEDGCIPDVTELYDALVLRLRELAEGDQVVKREFGR